MRIYQLQESIEDAEIVKVLCYRNIDEDVLYEGEFGEMPLKYATLQFSCFTPAVGDVLCGEFVVPSNEVR